MNALLLAGSPKGKAGTSRAIGAALLRRLEARGLAVHETTAVEAFASDESRARFLSAVGAADLIIVSFPLYVDQLPAPLIRALELVAEEGQTVSGAPRFADRAGRRIAAVVQCGFPETHQNRPAVEVMKKFAEDAGYHWAGGLALGMGGAVGRRPLDTPKGMLRNVARALDLAADSLAAGGDLPEDATRLMAKPLMPRWLYFAAANFGMKRQARKRGAGKRVYGRPYAA